MAAVAARDVHRGFDGREVLRGLDLCIEDGESVALLCRSGTAVSLVLSEPCNAEIATEIPLDPRNNRTGDHWHIRLDGLPDEFCYGYLVDGPGDLRREWFEGKRSIGVTAGASAPEILVQRVLEQLRDWGAQVPREVAGREERVTFGLPRELRRTGAAEEAGAERN